MRRAFAALLLMMVFALVAMAKRSKPDLAPTKAHPGNAVAAELQRAGQSESAPGTTTMDVIFVSRNCPACRSLVAGLAESRRVPPDGRTVLFVTDSIWPELQAIAGQRTRIVANAPGLARAVGLRATPTLVSYDTRSSHINLVAVGVPASSERFISAPRAH